MGYPVQFITQDTNQHYALFGIHAFVVLPLLSLDDPEVLQTNLNNEYRIAHEILGMSLEDLALCNTCACEASFIPESSRLPIWQKYFSPASPPDRQ